jgi:hypothetical protein
LTKGKVYFQLEAPEDGWALGALVDNPEKQGLFPQLWHNIALQYWHMLQSVLCAYRLGL